MEKFHVGYLKQKKNTEIVFISFVEYMRFTYNSILIG